MAAGYKGSALPLTAIQSHSAAKQEANSRGGALLVGGQLVGVTVGHKMLF